MEGTPHHPAPQCRPSRALQADAPPRLARDHGLPLWEALRHGDPPHGPPARIHAPDNISVADVLDDELTDDRLKGVLAFDTVLGHHAGAFSNSCKVSTIASLGRWRTQAALALPRGGMAAITTALHKAVAAAGVTIRCGRRDAHIRRRRAGSVHHAGIGRRATSGLVVSALHRQHTAFAGGSAAIRYRRGAPRAEHRSSAPAAETSLDCLISVERAIATASCRALGQRRGARLTPSNTAHSPRPWR